MGQCRTAFRWITLTQKSHSKSRCCKSSTSFDFAAIGRVELTLATGSDGGSLPPLPFTSTYDFESFATFEDPFSSYQNRTFEATPKPDPHNDESSPQELDNKLLGFSEATASVSVLDEAGNLADLQMSAELYGMFFVAEDVFGGESSGRPLELTCYRRNLWQCSGQISLPRMVTGIINEQGQQLRITELLASITAQESIEGKATEIISIPWKSANPQATEEAKVAGPPPNITLDLSSGQELDANRASVPVSWKRLQFKHATANNGRRKGLQQHYVVHINLLGKLESGEIVQIAEIQSGPVIVRGRSPRNFDSRKDVPLSGEPRKLERRNTAGSDNVALKTERDALQATNHALHMTVRQRGEATVTLRSPITNAMSSPCSLVNGQRRRPFLSQARVRIQLRRWP